MDDDKNRNWYQKYLQAGEYVRWSGKPGPGHFLTGPLLIETLVSLVVGVFFVIFFFAAFGHWGPNEPRFFRLYSYVIFAIAIAQFVLPLPIKYVIRQTSRYAVTNRRVLRYRAGKLEALDKVRMPSLYTTIFKDGRGTLRFGKRNDYYEEQYPAGFRRQWQWHDPVFSLENVEDPNRVELLIRSME